MIIVRAIAALTAALATVLATAVTATASTPIAWETGESLTTLQVIGTFVGIPLALVIGITLMGMAINAKARHFSPHEVGSDVEPVESTTP